MIFIVLDSFLKASCAAILFNNGRWYHWITKVDAYRNGQNDTRGNG